MSMKTEVHVLREASPNEARCIIRHDLGFYSNLVVAAVYSVPRRQVTEERLQQIEWFRPALVECIQKHPFLSATIQGASNNQPQWTRIQKLDLKHHFRVSSWAKSLGDEQGLLADSITRLHNGIRFTNVAELPAWLLSVNVLQSDSSSHRFLAAFVYSHSHGDGLSGIAFHRTFRQALHESLHESNGASNLVIDSLELLIARPPDDASTLPISLSYLLAPALGTYLPSFLATLLKVSGSLSGANEKTWVGSKAFLDSESESSRCSTCVELCSISAQSLHSVLVACRKNKATLTSLLNYLIAKSLNEALNEFGESQGNDTNYIAGVPINLRKVLGVAETVMGNYSSTAYLCYDEKLSDLTTAWDKLRLQSLQLAEAVSRVKDQPVGLLRFVSDIRFWLKSKIGQSRDCSWEMSNLGSFDPTTETLDIGMDMMVFSQPASPISAPLNFNVVSTKNGSINISLTWQYGALDLSDKLGPEIQQNRERRFVRRLLERLVSRVLEMGDSD